jgi:hypothetical protein
MSSSQTMVEGLYTSENGRTISAVMAHIGYSHGTIRKALLKRGMTMLEWGPPNAAASGRRPDSAQELQAWML